jgi:predicted amino acid racemase
VKKLLVVVALGATLTVAAATAAPNLVLTPTNLFTLIQSQQKVTANHGERIKALEAKQEEHLSRWEFAELVKRVSKLERGR